MDPWSALLGFFSGGLGGGIISYVLERVKHGHEIKKINEENKTEFMAERTVKYYLSNKTYTDRSFETLKKRIGGFDDDELRKILVRAGAIRLIRKDHSEWWRLLERNAEASAKRRQKDDRRS